MARKLLDLEMYHKHRLTIDYDKLKYIKDEMELFLSGSDVSFLKKQNYAEKVMFPGEIKANNTIEGINDDILLIESVISDAKEINDELQSKRILNLYKGYQYILSHKQMDSNHLSDLYHIFSNGLLEQADLNRMNEKYRTDNVFIQFNGRLLYTHDENGIYGEISEECLGIPANLIPKFVDNYFDFINSDYNCNGTSLTDYFIKSQIMHFYLEYIHPYFDVNSRTTRTMAMWYLLLNEAYPFIIFNRAITFNHPEYEKRLMEAKSSDDVTFFVRFMMWYVNVELEKEYVMHQIAESSSQKLSKMDYQTLTYFLSIKGESNVLNFISLYKRFNNKKSAKEIYETMLDSLIEKGILIIDHTTHKLMFSDYPNEVLKLNEKKFDKSSPKIKILTL